MVQLRSGDPTPLDQSPHAIFYPESDGTPLGETQAHAARIIDTVQRLDDHFADQPNIYVWMNLNVYYEKDNPDAVICPDVFVAIGAPKLPIRRTYQVWEEGVPPTVVFEVTSDSSRVRDLREKQLIYAGIGVQEYYVYDPLGRLLKPPLRGFRLVDGGYQPQVADRDGSLLSDALGLRLTVISGLLELFDRNSGRRLLTPAERAALAEQLARAEAEARTDAEQRAEREAEARQAAQHEARLAVQARQAAQTEAAAERQSRLAAEQRIADLERRLRGQDDG